MSSKLKKFLTGLKKSQEVLVALEENGIDVNRLIGISNAQGPIANIVRNVIMEAGSLIEPQPKINPVRSSVKKPKQLK
ncbi:TPA_asm: hypothetical protein [ssRNA phage Gerhypos.1_6]|uniref:Uncharacterized protein n=2 Tax=Leviviricetes TaxID=2842243 RepID=A0A8S5L2Q5_9VIRU|nr:hypothetical protein QIS10_gp3 [ssRNA phage Gerhypos.1_6]QDH89948.1 MAG: hypothetical protein H1Bulk29117_000002 [Leviviridae sp.]DAD52094.1 TPA_asm: hypothetical protein [ssRNA phage Gerhypos.1_6]